MDRKLYLDGGRPRRSRQPRRRDHRRGLLPFDGRSFLTEPGPLCGPCPGTVCSAEGEDHSFLCPAGSLRHRFPVCAVQGIRLQLRPVLHIPERRGVLQHPLSAVPDPALDHVRDKIPQAEEVPQHALKEGRDAFFFFDQCRNFCFLRKQ